MIFLVGKPGSGKSWLATAISKRRKTLVISQDDSYRGTCEQALGRNQPDDTLILLDRCNPTQAERHRLWQLVPLNRKRIVVYFDYELALCQHRVDRRLDHPTLRAGLSQVAVTHVDRVLDVPDPDTEAFDQLLIISSFESAKQALVALTPPLPLLKFPRTPHLLNLGAATEDDQVLSDLDIRGPLTMEEKIDGANLGISLDVDGQLRVQNRSHWISAADHAQFKPLTSWLDTHRDELVRLLSRDGTFLERYILYGEWMVAKHSIHYTQLPDFFLAFDLYDRVTHRFVSRSVLDSALCGSGIQQVPVLCQLEEGHHLNRDQILRMIEGPSAYTETGTGTRREGVYIRLEDRTRTFTTNRGKVVRGDFIAGNEHWSRGQMVWNRIISDSE